VEHPPLPTDRATLQPCQDAQTQKDWDSATSPVYADAMDLAWTLNEHGVVMNAFAGQKEKIFCSSKKGSEV